MDRIHKICSIERRKGHRKEKHGPGRDLQGSKKLLVLTMCGQMCGKL